MTEKNEIATRRDFIQAGIGVAAAVAAPNWASAAISAPLASARAPSQKMIGIQISAISFVDEGVNKVLDILQEQGQVNALFLSTFTYDGGTGGRQGIRMELQYLSHRYSSRRRVGRSRL